MSSQKTDTADRLKMEGNNMKKFLLRTNLQHFSEEGGGEGQNAGENGSEGAAGDKGASGGENGSEGQSGGEKDKTFTQADIDAAIKSRLKRENDKFNKKLEDLKKELTGEGQEGKKEGQQAAATDPIVAKAAEALKLANQKIVDATAQTEAIKLGVDPKYIADVVRLADLGKIEIGEDGNIDTSAISSSIDEVLKRVPLFKGGTEGEGSGGFKVGGEGQQKKSNSGWGNSGESSSKPWNRFK